MEARPTHESAQEKRHRLLRRSPQSPFVLCEELAQLYMDEMMDAKVPRAHKEVSDDELVKQDAARRGAIDERKAQLHARLTTALKQTHNDSNPVCNTLTSVTGIGIGEWVYKKAYESATNYHELAQTLQVGPWWQPVLGILQSHRGYGELGWKEPVYVPNVWFGETVPGKPHELFYLDLLVAMWKSNFGGYVREMNRIEGLLLTGRKGAEQVEYFKEMLKLADMTLGPDKSRPFTTAHLQRAYLSVGAAAGDVATGEAHKASLYDSCRIVLSTLGLRRFGSKDHCLRRLVGVLRTGLARPELGPRGALMLWKTRHPAETEWILPHLHFGPPDGVALAALFAPGDAEHPNACMFHHALKAGWADNCTLLHLVTRAILTN